MRRLIVVASIMFSAAVTARSPAQLPVSEEIASALEAAPQHLRTDAGVYVLEADGYRLARKSRNGFNCLIERDIGAAFEPKCFDVEGSDTVLPVILFRAERRAHDVADIDIDRAVAVRFARGEFVPPRRVGICYMLSARNMVVVDREAGRVSRVGPRLMLYAPYLNNLDVGALPDLDSRLFVSHEGSETAMIVIPVESEKRTRAYYLSPDNLTPLARTPASASTNPPHRDSFGKAPHDRCDSRGTTPCRIEAPQNPVSPTR